MAKASKASPALTIRNRVKELRMVPASELRPSPDNWRRHPTFQRKVMSDMLAEIGFAGAVLARETPEGLVTIDGHLRAEVGGKTPIPVLVLDVDEAEAKKLLATFDPIGALAQPDTDVLVRLLSELEFASKPVNDMLEALVNGETEPMPDLTNVPDADVDRAEELAQKWGTAKGQIWEIPSKTVPGKAHRLMCGDSTNQAHIQSLMVGTLAGLFATDPPYGIAYDSRANKPDGHKRRVSWEEIEGDNEVGENIQPFLEDCFRAWLPNLKQDAAWYLWHGMLTQAFFAAAAAAAAAGLLLHRQIIWVKPALIIGRGDYHWQHELAFYGWQKGHRPPFLGKRNQSSIWQIKYDGEKGRAAGNEHPTQKPVELWTIPIQNHLRKGEIAAEPFAGSGSQLIAGEITGRLCYGMEIEPKYVAVCLERMAAMGLEPRLSSAD